MKIKIISIPFILALILFIACQKTPAPQQPEKPREQLSQHEVDTFPDYDMETITHKLEQPRHKRWPPLAKLLHLKQGLVIGDIGCGSGAYTFRMAMETGPTGKVYAVDVQEILLDRLRTNLENKRFNPYGNIEVIKNSYDNAMIPADSLDLALMANLHFHSHPTLMPENISMIDSVYKAMKPGGRLVIEDGNENLTPEAADYVLHHYKSAGFAVESGPDYLNPEAPIDITPEKRPDTFYIVFVKPIS